MPRRKSLRLPTQAPPTPIPPSLQHSPYLTSPIFRNEFTSPRIPSEEDEKWLQDTVPIPKHIAATEGGTLQTPKGSIDRRGSIIQPSRRPAKAFCLQDEGPRTAPLEGLDSTAFTEFANALAQAQQPGAAGKTRSRAPYPSPPLAFCQWGGDRRKCSTTSPRSAAAYPGYLDSTMSRVGSRGPVKSQEYFPPVPPMR